MLRFDFNNLLLILSDLLFLRVIFSSVVHPDGGEEEEVEVEGGREDLGDFEVQILRPPHHKKK